MTLRDEFVLAGRPVALFERIGRVAAEQVDDVLAGRRDACRRRSSASPA